MVVKPGSSAELPCPLLSNRAIALWKVNGSILTEASQFHLMSDTGLLIYSVGPEEQGVYECWSVERAASKDFSKLVAGYRLSLLMPVKPRSPGHLPRSSSSSSTASTSSTVSSRAKAARTPTAPAEGNHFPSATPLLTSALPSSTQQTPPLTPALSSNIDHTDSAPLQPMAPSSNAPGTKTLDPSAEYLQHDNSGALLFLFLLFFLLFLAALAYNCYMRYLPAPCLRLRAALLGTQKKPQPEYAACEAGLMEMPAEKPDLTEQLFQNGAQLRALRDTGYETEPECGNGQVPSQEGYGGDKSPPKERPFDVDCVSQPIEYADAD